jgi:hypothetical protein
METQRTVFAKVKMFFDRRVPPTFNAVPNSPIHSQYSFGAFPQAT